MTLAGVAGAALVATGVLWFAPAPLSPSCDYVNVDYQCRPGPNHDQSDGGIDLPCRDGTFTHSTHRQGACSHHGGLA
ncbi:hypothetical protein B8W69_00385 [Mycobacterium vulneris]|uniref:DUF3761 domain-containing protein n=1 Tax=Mycolicibacterium vulneris TaxID=547163 RepID=A0A1X2LF20_9MYCO|nr:hypothetical protein B8W69_00385 [Mycolicibacterium vulneris]